MFDFQTMPTDKDTLYSVALDQVTDFRFDDQVARVFPDMIKRSVPGYSHIIAMIGVLANQYAQPDSQLYDLGSSLGAASLAMRHRVQTPGVRIVAVDNSQAMLDRARDFLESEDLPVPVECLCADITELELKRASFVVLNFTLQFIAPQRRSQTLSRIYSGMLPGAALILSEKLCFDDPQQDALLSKHHHDFKRANGYSDLEISQKRQAIEHVMLPETAQTHIDRLHAVGFKHVSQWFQSFNFASFIAIK